MTPSTSISAIKALLRKDKVKSLYEFTNEMIKTTISNIEKSEKWKIDNIIYNPLYKNKDFYKEGTLLYYCFKEISYFKNEQYNNTSYYFYPHHVVYIKGKEIRNIDELEFPDEKFKITISNSSKENKKFHDVLNDYYKPPNYCSQTKPCWVKVNLHRCEYNGHPFYNKTIIGVSDDKIEELTNRILIHIEDGWITAECIEDFTLEEFDKDYNYIGKNKEKDMVETSPNII
jgi:hypothetical protein